MNQTNISESKAPEKNCLRDSKSPIIGQNQRRTSSESSKQTARKFLFSLFLTLIECVVFFHDSHLISNSIHTGTSTSPTDMKKEVSIDVSDLEKLLTSIVIATKDCHVKSLTEFYIRLEKKISSFKDMWDRSSLPEVTISCYRLSGLWSTIIKTITLLHSATVSGSPW